MKSAYRNFLLTAITLVACIVIMEFSLRAFVPVRNVGPSLSEYDPVYGRRLKADFTTTRITPEFEMRFTTNSHGFRGAEPIPSDLRPILFLGDSFTMGYGVSDGFEFPALIAKRLSSLDHWAGRPVLNAGIGDSGNGRPLKFLRAKGAEIAPKLVVIQVMENDFSDNLRERMFALNDQTDELLELDIPDPGGLAVAQSWIDKSPVLPDLHLVGFSREIVLVTKRSRPTKPTAEADRGDRLTYKLIEELLSFATGEQFETLLLAVGLRDDRLAKLRDLSARFLTDLIRMPSRKERPDLYYITDGHWNQAGHVQAADMIVDWMTQNP